jgi:hypothetical protein
MVEATLNPGGGGIMDMALAARGDFLVVSVELSTRGTDTGADALVGGDLAADVTVLDTGFKGTVFFTGRGFLATGFFLAGMAFLEAAGFFTATGFLIETAFLAGTAFLLISFFATAFLLATFLLGAFLLTAFVVTAALFKGVGFLTAAAFFAATTFFAGDFTALVLGLPAATALVLLLALLLLECLVDFNANLLTGWRRVH